MLLIPNFNDSEKFGKTVIKEGKLCNLMALTLDQKSVKSLRVTKIVKEIEFKGVCDERESKKGFQRQSVTKYLRLSLVFM